MKNDTRQRGRKRLDERLLALKQIEIPQRADLPEDDRFSDFAGLLWKGPPMAEVRGIDERDAAIEECHGFSTR